MAETSLAPKTQALSFLQGGGVMGERMRAKDWENTPVGPPHLWPQSLKTVIKIVLTSRYAMWMLWGPELTFFFNDAYLPTLGVKEKLALGERSDKVWAEIWPDIWPRIESVLRTNTATYDENLLLFLERSGYPEETYHTFSYSPLSDDGGAVVGMLCVVTEDTDKVIDARRLELLGRLGTRLTSVLNEDVLFRALQDICRDQADLPFVMICLSDETGRSRLRMTEETRRYEPFASRFVDEIGCDFGPDPDPRVIPLPENLTQAAPSGHWPQSPTQVVVVPFMQGGSVMPAGHLIIGLNPFRAFDGPYRRFLELLAGQVGASLTNVRAHAAERERAASLAEIDRAKTVFFSNISHEFRTPLTLMLGPLADALADTDAPLADIHRGRLETAHRNSQRLLKLVNALLDFSRLEAGRVQATYEPI